MWGVGSIQEVIQRECCVLGYDTEVVLCTGGVMCWGGLYSDMVCGGTGL